MVGGGDMKFWVFSNFVCQYSGEEELSLKIIFSMADTNWNLNYLEIDLIATACIVNFILFWWNRWALLVVCGSWNSKRHFLHYWRAVRHTGAQEEHYEDLMNLGGRMQYRERGTQGLVLGAVQSNIEYKYRSNSTPLIL